ncbi:MAG: hypothetical protein AAF497_07590 [Planctomycetota bacterium]
MSNDADVQADAATIPLGMIAHARSGDKGNHANIGVIAYTKEGYDYLNEILGTDRVDAFFDPLGPSSVVRYELPGIGALNFLLHDVLRGGASQSLRTDNQGKVLGLAILEMPIPCPNDLNKMTRDRRRNE